MFCRKCGARLNDEALFCTQCGASASRTPHNADETPLDSPLPAQEAGSDAANATAFAAAMDETKKRGRRRMPLIVLVALAVMLASGAAWAAYTVYTEVIAPWIEAQQTMQTEESQPAEGAGEEPASEEKSESEATGDPQSILQVAEVLAMDAADIPSFLESQGMSAQASDSELAAMGYAAPATAWKCAFDDTAPFSSLEESGIDIEPQYYPDNHGQDEFAGGPSVIFGANAMPPHDIGFFDRDSYDMQEDDLAAGSKPTNILVENLPLPLLDESSVSAFVKACRLPEASALFSTDSIVDWPKSFIATGFVAIDGEQYLWYFGQVSYDSDTYGLEPYVDSFIGCCPASMAGEAVVDGSLYTQQEWAEADDDARALMAGQSILQGAHTSNGGYRTNLATGEPETLYSYQTGDVDENGYPKYEQFWVTEEELAQLIGEDAAKSRFAF